MMLITAVLWTLNVGFTLGAPSALGTGDAMAHWKAEIAAANEAWAGRRLAILKIDDAVYLKEGETAYLIFKDGSYRWSLTKPAGLRPQLRFANGKALLQMLGEEGDLDVLARPGGLFTLSDTADIKAQIAQIAPDQEGLRVMLYNQANPSPKEFKGVDYYPYDKAFAVTAKFEPAASIQGEDFQTSRGWWKRFYNMGTAVFALEGKEHRLPMYSETSDPSKIATLTAFFMDQLTGKETYGVGRYIDIAVPAYPPSEIKIDFNFAYNPNCARSPHYNCPQAKVTLAVDLRAGEKKPAKSP